MESSCQVDTALEILVGKWKHKILFQLINHDVMRFNELKRAIPGITQKMLTSQLRELEQNDIIQRQVYPQIPPKVEYSMTPYGESLKPLLDAMHSWGSNHIKHLDQLFPQTNEQ
ncbi:MULTISPECIES: winged helix-turn-helix transcriptional regulator [Shouchella]|uniref:Winged helix-turn-helix transcriptional regulator n=2 Tax=Shouchella TaxID=2893057 RepID=A0ABY7W862_9BACI|nr:MULTISPECIES: winged helix-turn-helix transcriptional regulator [Shouchella]MED4126686.1 winged helix-turn-helix transcriptional regulator [Shouchella miscanthi]WDF04614.1 winged helix-turn-helix transcriptional regulator [Shouchella hunanensis]GAF21796.1 transcriptional regulator, HxlR family [Bacillus sp. JCM 19047]